MSKLAIDVLYTLEAMTNVTVQGDLICKIEIMVTLKKETHRDYRRFLYRQIRAVRESI